jgi:hypothetical protein
MPPLRVSAGFKPAPIWHLSGTNPQVSGTRNLQSGKSGSPTNHFSIKSGSYYEVKSTKSGNRQNCGFATWHPQHAIRHLSGSDPHLSGKSSKSGICGFLRILVDKKMCLDTFEFM